MKLVSILLFVTATLSLIKGGHAKNINTVPTTSELEEGILNKQNENDGGIVAFGSSPSKSKSSKVAKGSNNIMAVVDKLVATAFGLVGILGLTDKIDEEESIDILTGIISKADEFESAIIGEDGGEGEGRRRLQSFGTNNNLFVGYLLVSVFRLQGLDDAAVLDRLTERFTERVVNIISGILDPAPATTTTTSTTTTTTTVAQGIVAVQPTGGGILVTEQATSMGLEGIVGFSFVPSRDIEVTKLGGYDPEGDGFANSHGIFIFDTSVDVFNASPLASIFIRAGNPPGSGATFVADETGGNGGTWFITLATPLTLTAGTRYDIIGDGFTDPDLFLDGTLTTYNIGQDLTSVQGVRLMVNGMSLDIADSPGVLFVGPNFEYNLL